MTQPPLRACPTCATPVSQTQLGMRDYSRWLVGVLPGKVSGSDIDFLLDQSSTGRMLALEFKAGNKPLGLGQRLLFQQLVDKGVEVWCVWEYQNAKGETDRVKVGVLDALGQVRFMQEITPAQLASQIKAWWNDGLAAKQKGTTP